MTFTPWKVQLKLRLLVMEHLSPEHLHISSYHFLYPSYRENFVVVVSGSLKYNNKKINQHLIIFIIGVHTVAALSGTEDYHSMKNGFAPVLQEINELLEDG